MKHHYYVTTVTDPKDCMLHWGVGQTQAEADGNCQEFCNKRKMKKARRWVASSDFPFAPRDRDANKDEADVWVDRGTGGIVSLRAELNGVTG